MLAFAFLPLVAIMAAAAGEPEPPRSPPQVQPAAGSDSYAWVFLKGTLRAGRRTGDEESVELMTVMVDAAGNFQLDFADQTDLIRKADALLGRPVLVRGELAAGPGPRLVVRVADIGPAQASAGTEAVVKMLRETGEALVAYQPNQLEDAKRVCAENGLSVTRVYGPGNYLVCRWPKGSDLGRALAALEQNRAIRYVVPNAAFQVGPAGATQAGNVGVAPAGSRPPRHAPSLSPK